MCRSGPSLGSTCLKITLLIFSPFLFVNRASAQNPTPPPTTQEKPSESDSSPKPAQSAPSKDVQEVASHDSPATFKVRVNVVLVRVVVRDEHGKVVPSLKKEDFQLYDGRKLQTISSFAVETPQSHTASLAAASGPGSSPATEAIPGKAVVLPQRFVSMIFDDIHFSLQDAAFVRDSATRFFNALAPIDRVAINTTSGQLTQEFTDDHQALRKALLSILPRPTHVSSTCPDMSFYEADLIANRNDTQALAVATQETIQCAFGGDQRMSASAQSLAQAAALQTASQADAESDYTYRHLEDSVRRLANMPGQRIVILVSPGFILSMLQNLNTSELVDRATRANVVINTIDARGLYTPDIMGDIGNPPVDSVLTTGYKSTYRVAAQSAQEDVLAQLADGTGGTFYHNRNDVDEAMRQAGAAPEVSYLLSFSPQNLKIDGRFHSLKVALTSKQKFSIQARHGYFAPRTIADPAETAKEEIQEALFSQEEIHEFPVDFQTQFFRNQQAARLAVLAHLDVKGIRFRKDSGRNNDQLTVVTGIFDENGQYVTGGEKIIDMKLRDITYDRLSRSGLIVKSSFDIKPGTYLVRLVVRDAEGAQMAARNGAVVIPY
ncbi:MAG TPA: VWA domain-containing protein [Candidatus Angelobacter sp.]|nr:VWA domain-containing protein [Candidatus Angelobacter sp.]